MAFIVTEGIFIALRLSRLSSLSTHNSHGAGKISEEDEEDWQTTCRKLWGQRRDFFLSNITFYIQKLIAPLQQTVNTSGRKFDKKLLKFSFFVLFTLFTSCHFQTVFFLQLFNFAIFNYSENLQLPPGH